MTSHDERRKEKARADFRLAVSEAINAGEGVPHTDFMIGHLMGAESEAAWFESQPWHQAISNASAEITLLRSQLETAVGALETLRVAVNDKQPDPGAVAFIDQALATIRGEG